MGLQVAVARYAHNRSRDARVLFEWALLYTAATSVIGTALFFWFVPRSTSQPLLVGGRLLGFSIFLAVVTGMSFSLLIDVRLMVLRRWGWVFGRAVLVAGLRLPFLWIHPLHNEALWLFVLVGGSQALSGFVGAIVLQVHSWSALFPLPTHVGRALRYSSVNYLGQLATQAPFFVIPVVVLLTVRPSTNAVFYVAWSVMAVVFLSIQMISQALLAEGGKGNARLHKQVRVTLLLALGLACVSALIAHLGSGIIVSVYGSAYGRVGGVLPTLALAMIPWALTATLLSEARVRENTLSTVAIGVGFAVFTLVPAVLLSTHNTLRDVSNAWLYGNAAAGCLAVGVSWSQRNVGRADREGEVPSPEALRWSVPVAWRPVDDVGAPTLPISETT